MSDKDWKIYASDDLDIVIKNNAIWSYSNMISNKDYLRPFLRFIYYILLITGHWMGLGYIIYNHKRFGILLFMLATFSYLFIIETDMRYFIFPQLICLCISFTLLLQIIGQSILRTKKHE